MAKTKRDNLKRKLAQSYFHNNVTLERLAELYEVFNPVHPEYAEGLQACAELCIHIEHLILAFAKAAWEMSEESLKKYRS